MLEQELNKKQQDVKDENIKDNELEQEELDILVGNNNKGDNIINDNELKKTLEKNIDFNKENFRKEINDIVSNETLKKRNLLINESRLRLKKELDDIDNEYFLKLKNNTEYNDAKRKSNKAGVIVASIITFVVAFPALAIPILPALTITCGALIGISIKKSNEAKKILKKIKKQFNTKKKLLRTQEKIKNLNNPELQKLNNEFIRLYEPKKISDEENKLNKISKKNNKIFKIYKKVVEQNMNNKKVQENIKNNENKAQVEQENKNENIVSKQELKEVDKKTDELKKAFEEQEKNKKIDDKKEKKDEKKIEQKEDNQALQLDLNKLSKDREIKLENNIINIKDKLLKDSIVKLKGENKEAVEEVKMNIDFSTNKVFPIITNDAKKTINHYLT